MSGLGLSWRQPGGGTSKTPSVGPAVAAISPSFWLDPSNPNLFVTSGSGLVTSVLDAAGSGISVTGSIAYKQAAPDLLNSLPCVAMRTTDAGTVGLSSSSGGPNAANPWTMMCLVNLLADPAVLGGGLILGAPGGGGPILGIGGLSATGTLWEGKTTAFSTNVQIGTPTPTGPFIATFTYDGTNVNAFIDGAFVLGPTAITYASTAGAFGLQMWSTGQSPSSIDVYQALWAPEQATSLQIAPIVSYWTSQYGIQSAQSVRGVGDSNMAGYGLADYNPPTVPASTSAWIAVAMRAVNASRAKSVTVDNQAVSGSLASAFASTTTSYVARFSARAQQNTIVIGLGTNDITAAATTSQVIASLQTIIAHARSIGYQRIVLATVLPCDGRFAVGGAGDNTRLAVNAWMRTTGLPVIDFDTLTGSINVRPTTSNANFQNPDPSTANGVHLSQLGHANAGAYAATVLSPLFPA